MHVILHCEGEGEVPGEGEGEGDGEGHGDSDEYHNQTNKSTISQKYDDKTLLRTHRMHAVLH